MGYFVGLLCIKSTRKEQTSLPARALQGKSRIVSGITKILLGGCLNRERLLPACRGGQVVERL